MLQPSRTLTRRRKPADKWRRWENALAVTSAPSSTQMSDLEKDLEALPEKSKGKGKGKKRASTPRRPDASTTSKPGSRSSSPAKPKAAACHNWKKGTCTRGDKCRWPHVAPCKFYPNCRRGEACEFAHHDKSSSKSTSTKAKAALAMQDTPMAGMAIDVPFDDLPMASFALDLPFDETPMAFMARGSPDASPPPTKLAKCLLRSRVHFSFRARTKARKHCNRKTMQPANPGNPVYPDLKEAADFQLILDGTSSQRKSMATGEQHL